MGIVDAEFEERFLVVDVKVERGIEAREFVGHSNPEQASRFQDPVERPEKLVLVLDVFHEMVRDDSFYGIRPDEVQARGIAHDVDPAISRQVDSDCCPSPDMSAP
jgi:hypothetical protein